MKRKVLFVCSGNQDRSPTAENLYRQHPKLEVRSAGTSRFACTKLTEALVQWADFIVVMEKHHGDYVRENYSTALADKPLFCLDILDRYRFMDDMLMNLIDDKMKLILERHPE